MSRKKASKSDVDTLDGKSLVDDRAALRNVLERAQDGDESVLPALRRALKEEPKISNIFVDLAGSLESSIVSNMAGDDLMLRECLPRNLKEMRKDLTGENPSPLEKLLVERVVICWLQLQHFEMIYAQNLSKSQTLAQSDFQQKRIDRVHRRYLSAIKTLAQIRKMGPTVQINIAEQQVNTAS